MADLCFCFKSPLFLPSLCAVSSRPLWNQTEYIRQSTDTKFSQFLPPLLSPFTFPGVFLLPFSSYPFCLPTFTFRPIKEEGEMENHLRSYWRAGSVKLGSASAICCCMNLLLFPRCWAGAWSSEGFTVPLSPCQCSFPTRPVLINKAQLGSTDLEAGTPGLAAAPC